MMFVKGLKQILIILIITTFAIIAKAQQNHFVYLQTENGQPFYVRLNNNVVSSSQAGYVILPNLAEGEYQLVVGFPKNEFPEENFNLTIEKKNEGYLLKNFGEKGWSLFNMQTLALIDNMNAPPVITTTSIQDDPFSKMLANVVKDSSLLQKVEPVVEKPVNIVVESPIKTVTETPVITVVETPANAVLEESVANVIENPINNVVGKPLDSNKIQSPVVVKAPSISRFLSLREKEGIEMIYIDRGENKNDTVRIFMPVSNAENKNEAPIIVTESKTPYISTTVDTSQLTITPTIITPLPETNVTKPAPVQIEILNESKDSSVEKATTSENPAVIIYKQQPTIIKSEEQPVVEKKESEIIVLPEVVTYSKVNSDCKAFANDTDFLKLRKKMAAENNNDDMVQVAKKVFRLTCFSTEQIKNLSHLFINDEGKYMFFDAAYAYTSDTDKYDLLEAQLTDEYYIARFKAMIHK